MKKIIIGLTIILFSAASVHAGIIGNLSLTGGIANNSGVFGATAKETNLTETGTAGHIKKESGVFTDSFGSQFIELGIGSWFSVGYEHTPDSVSTPTHTSRDNSGTTTESNVSVDFNDLNTTYVKVNLPFAGLYVKAGTVDTDLDIKEVMGSGSTYANVSTSGNVTALGHSSYIKDTGFGIRVEALYMELDNVTTNNGGTTASIANGGLNTIDASHMEGLTGKIALTYTFGRD